jgi:homocysteine S-methyltransferase
VTVVADTPAFLERIVQSPLIFDGGMGTMIYSRGVFIHTCYDELNLTAGDMVLGIHQAYVEAGADVIETNTFGANRIKLAEHGLGDKVESINRQAVRLARDAAGKSVYVVGSVGPCTKPGQLLTRDATDAAESAFGEQISVLAESGVDLLLLETFSNIEELLLAARLARRTGLGVAASFAVDQNGETAVGTPAMVMASVLDAEDHVDVVGLNCGTGPVGIYDALEGVLSATNKPVVVMPNAGLPKDVGGRMLYLTDPEYFTEYAKRFIELGVRGVGGCCGTTPEHIAQAAKAVKGLSGVKAHVEIKAHVRPAAEVEVILLAAKSKLGAKLAAGETVTSVELLPPKSTDMTALLAKSSQCGEAGVDAINIPDGPRASARISPMIAALTIEREVGIESVLHYCCRDRNLIGMQSDLLGGYAAGLHNFLIITGDPPKLGDYPDATGVFDVDAIGLTQAATNLNHGTDIGGSPVDPPTGILIGVGANPCAVEMDREINRYFAKLDAGAEFAITQPIFDVEALMAFLDRVASYERTIPVVAGVWPLLSFRNAEFMNNEVPGVEVPDAILERMSKCSTKQEGRAEGIAIAREIIQQIGPRVAGIQVSAPLGNVPIALDVLAGVI